MISSHQLFWQVSKSKPSQIGWISGIAGIIDQIFDVRLRFFTKEITAKLELKQKRHRALIKIIEEEKLIYKVSKVESYRQKTFKMES